MEIYSLSSLSCSALLGSGCLKVWGSECSVEEWLQELTGAERPHKKVRDCLGDEAFLARCISLPPGSTELCHALLQLWPFRCCLHMLVLPQLHHSLGNVSSPPLLLTNTLVLPYW